MVEMCIEKDSMGEVEVFVEYYWGVQIQCFFYNFEIGCDIFVWG